MLKVSDIQGKASTSTLKLLCLITPSYQRAKNFKKSAVSYKGVIIKGLEVIKTDRRTLKV